MIEEAVTTIQEFAERPELLWVFLVVFLTLVSNYVARRLLVKLEKRTLLTNSPWDDALVRSARKPAAWLIWVMGISYAAEVLARGTDSTLEQLINPARFIAVVALLAYFLGRFISEAEKAFIKKGADITTANAIGKLLRVSVFITAGLSVLQSGPSYSGSSLWCS